jgi:hypothetical protein
VRGGGTVAYLMLKVLMTAAAVAMKIITRAYLRKHPHIKSRA